MQRFVDVERGPLAFAWALVTRPGRVAREYIEGHRRRHYGPFATLAVVVGVTALVIDASGYAVLSQDGLPPGPTDLLQRHFNLLQLAQFPLIGGACALLFSGARRTWAEHMVLAAYALSVRAALLAIAGVASVGGPRAWSGVRGAAAAALAHAAMMAVLFALSAAYVAWVVRP